MRTAVASSLVALAVAACQLDDAGPPELGTQAAPIINGTRATLGQFPTVVAIRNSGLCTGTLIAPDVVLTAAHCVHPATLGLASQAQVTAQTRVVLDTLDVTATGGRTIAARDTVAVASFAEPGDPDVGLVFLAEPVTDRAPTPLNLTSASAPATVAVTMVGYGKTATGSYGRLLYAGPKGAVSCAGYGVSDAQFLCFDQRDGAGICSGDSGGPALATIDGVEKVVGITSFGDRDCTVLGAYMRVDAAATRDFLMAHAPAVACRADDSCDPACGSAGLPVDPDCRVRCSDASACAGDEYCGADGTCMPAPFSPGALGAACAGGTDCVSGQCASDGETTLCAEACGAAGACPDGFTCQSDLCWPAASGGCSAGGAGDTAGAAAALLLLLAVAARPARRRRV